MANIDNAFTIDILSLDDNLLVVSGAIDPSTGGGYEAPLGSLYVRTDGSMYQKTNTADIDWTIFTSGGGSTDEKIKVSANDTTANYLFNKLNSSGLNISLTENNDGGNETFSIDTTIPLQDLQDEIDAIELASGGIFATDGTFDVTTVDTALSTVNTPTDLLNTLSQLENAIGATSELATVVLGLSVSASVSASFADIAWTVTTLENDATVLEHNNINTERVDIKDTGLHLISYVGAMQDDDAGEDAAAFRVFLNGLTMVPGSLRSFTFKDTSLGVNNTFTAELTAGDYITLQMEGEGNKSLDPSANLMVTRLSGLRGIQGTAGTNGTNGTDGADGIDGLTGSGSNVNLLNDGIAIPNTPHGNLNFSDQFTVTDNAGTADISLSSGTIFGSEYARAESLGLSATTSIVFLNKATLNVNNLVGGVYRVGVSYGWNHSNGGNDFEARFQENAVDMGEIHKQEPKDSAGNFGNSGTSQRHYVNRVFYRTLLPSTAYAFTVDFRTDTDLIDSGIWDTIIEFWRVS